MHCKIKYIINRLLNACILQNIAKHHFIMTPRIFVFFCFIIICQNLFAQQAKYIDAWEAGNFEKCLSSAEKVIKKDSKNIEALLYKCLALSEIGNNAELAKTYPSSVEKSLSSMVSLQKKDKKGTMFSDNKKLIEIFRENVLKKAREYMSLANSAKAINLFDKMILLFNDTYSNYYKGSLLVRQHQAIEGTECLNTAAKNIYLEFKDGGEKKPYLSEAFTELAEQFKTFNDYNSARTVLIRAHKIFPENDSIKNLIYDVNKEDYYYHESDLVKKPTAIMHIVEGIRLFKNDKKFETLYYQIVKEQALNFIYKEEYDKFNTYIVEKALNDTVLNKDSMYAFSFALSKTILIDHMPTNKANYKTQKELCKKLAPACLTIFTKKNGLANNEKASISIVNAAVSKNEKWDVLYYLFAFRSIFPANPELKKIYSDQMTAYCKLFETSINEIQSWNDVQRLVILFPEEKQLLNYLNKFTIKLIEKSLAQKDFSKAGVFIAFGREEFPLDAKILALKKQWVVDDFKENYKGSNIAYGELGWTGNVENCDAGALPETSLKKITQRLNYLRRIAGVPDGCEFREEFNNKCQKSALIMDANNELTHNPEKSFKCYTNEGGEGSANSNISQGAYGSDALTLFVEDGGSNNYSVGHRRWLLNPARKIFGFGSTNSYAALWVLGGVNTTFSDSIYDKYDNQFVCWPPADFVPEPLVFRRWSFSLQNADLSNATISMTNNGKAIALKKEEYYAGYGSPTTVWVPEITNNISTPTTYKITIGNVKLNDKPILSYTYSVTILPIVN